MLLWQKLEKTTEVVWVKLSVFCNKTTGFCPVFVYRRAVTPHPLQPLQTFIKRRIDVYSGVFFLFRGRDYAQFVRWGQTRNSSLESQRKVTSIVGCALDWRLESNSRLFIKYFNCSASSERVFFLDLCKAYERFISPNLVKLKCAVWYISTEILKI